MTPGAAKARQYAANDPRRPSDKVFNVPTESEESSVEGSFTQLIAMVTGMMALMIRYKLLAWVSLFTTLSALATLRTHELKFAQVASSLMISGMSLFMIYFTPPPVRS
eukprot:TRINITY_DN38740_c0_g1_i1.p1 TRINITY_DN38740_c0_g1~~TRINITY_DN38740_c0_g1_i1.p1  ORF type:complete len:108 (-),score=10.20 TRINITY_DN38740_c0_g1_i1:46-369(-)